MKTSISIRESYQFSKSPFHYHLGNHFSPYYAPNYTISADVCNILHPCQNNGTCTNQTTTVLGYHCSCFPNFNGTQCQYDHRPCQSDTCQNHGQCNQTSTTTFVCRCNDGWQGDHCETMIDDCEKITCFNGGVCQPSLLNFTCRCLGDSYSGRYCEIQASRITRLQTVSKSFAYIGIIMILMVAIFVVTLDVLKYCFGIDLAKPKGKDNEPKKKNKKNKRIGMAIRYIYVHEPPKVSSMKIWTVDEEPTV